jgi:hypothetical protein
VWKKKCGREREAEGKHHITEDKKANNVDGKVDHKEKQTAVGVEGEERIGMQRDRWACRHEDHKHEESRLPSAYEKRQQSGMQRE